VREIVIFSNDKIYCARRHFSTTFTSKNSMFAFVRLAIVIYAFHTLL
jgi:hypothetical protein